MTTKFKRQSTLVTITLVVTIFTGNFPKAFAVLLWVAAMALIVSREIFTQIEIQNNYKKSIEYTVEEVEEFEYVSEEVSDRYTSDWLYGVWGKE